MRVGASGRAGEDGDRGSNAGDNSQGRRTAGVVTHPRLWTDRPAHRSDARRVAVAPA